MSTARTALTNGHDPADNPFDRPRVNVAHQRREAEGVTEKRLKQWGFRRYSVESLPDGQRWARKLSRDIAEFNARRDPMKHAPRLIFSGDRAVNAGATDEHMAALHELSEDECALLREREAAELEATRIRIRDIARRIAARKGAVKPPEPVSLNELLAQLDNGPTYRIDGLLPAGGRALLAAQYKAGKSTLVGNAGRTLVDGGQFLGRFDVTPVGKVVLIDTELDTRTLRRWLRDQGISNTAAITVVPLRGSVSTFDILDPTTRSEWAQRLAGADVVILDCLRPVLDALGLSEDKDAGRVLVAFDALLAEIGATEGVVVTHMGHANERARGDSRLLDWPDALWKIVRGDDEGDDTEQARYLSAIGRDVAVPEGQLTYDAATRRLTYTDGSRKDSAARAAMPELLALVRAEPGRLSKNAAETRLKDDHGIAQKSARAAIREAIKDGSIVATPGPHNANLLSPAPDPLNLPAAEGHE